MNQVIGLFLVSYILSHPNVIPQWLSTFEVSRFGVPENGVSICDQAGLRHKRDVGDMVDRMPLMNSSVMLGSMMRGHGPMMHGHGPMMHGHGPMMHHDEMLPHGHQSGEKSANVDDSKVLPKLDDLLLPGQMMPDVRNMMPEVSDGSQDVRERSDDVGDGKVLSPADVGKMKPEVHHSMGVQLANVLSNPDTKISANSNDKRDDDDRDLIIPIDTSRLRNQLDFASKHRLVGLNAGE